MSTPITLLQQREIEAKIVAPLFRAFAAEIGESRAREILSQVITNLAHQAGCHAAQQSAGNSIAQLRQVVENWRSGGALELEILSETPEKLEFNVTRCRFAEMYHALGLNDLGPLLSCQRDGALITGFNAEMEFHRSQTLMEGARHCDFRFQLAPQKREE